MLLNLVPGSLPRYAMPALVLGVRVNRDNFIATNCGLAALARWQACLAEARRRTVSVIALLAVAGINVYAFAIIPKLERRENVKQLAAQIDQAVVPDAPIYALDPNYQPLFFYLRTKLVYLKDLDDCSARCRLFIGAPGAEAGDFHE